MSHKNEVWETSKWFISGAVSGMSNTLAGHPFDTLKVRLQTEGMHGRFNGVIDCFRKTVQTEGWKGLYKGMSPPFFAMFGIFGMTKKSVAKFMNQGNRNLTVSQTCVAGAITGALVTFVVVPVEQIKARLQVQYSSKETQIYSGPIDCSRKLIKNNGILGLYKGFTSTVLTRINAFGYFGGQEYAKQYFVKRSGNVDYKLNSLEQFICGGVAGVCYWTTAFPFDVVKNRMMSQPDITPRKYPTVWSCVKHIYQVDGIKGFGRGFVPCAMRTLPANGITWLTLAWVTDILHKLDPIFEKKIKL